MGEIQKVIVIGSGPAGWSAALYMARAQLQPLVFAGEKSGGQLMLTTVVENFPGFPQGIQGPDLMIGMRQQAEHFGAVIQDTNVTRVDFSKRPFRIWANTGKSGTEEIFQAESVFISTGAESMWLGIPGEEEFIGRGVSTCAVCDAPFFKQKKTIVVGGGDAALEEALALTKFAESVLIVHRRDSFRASKIMVQRVMDHPKIKVLWNSALKEIKGETKVTGVVVEDINTHTIHELPMDGVFVAIGHKPSTALFQKQLLLDEKGYIVTHFALGSASLALAQSSLQDNFIPYLTMTSVDGVFAAGDVVDFKYKQAATAAGYGVMAALDIEKWLEMGSAQSAQAQSAQAQSQSTQ